MTGQEMTREEILAKKKELMRQMEKLYNRREELKKKIEARKRGEVVYHFTGSITVTKILDD